MTATPHASRRLVERCFEGTLAPADWDDLFAHLRGCPPCHEHFERTRLAFRALAGEEPATGVHAGERQRAPRALARAEADSILRAALLPPAPRLPRLRWRALVAAALVGCAAFAVFVLRPRPRPDDFAERAAHTTGPGLDVLCMSPREDAATVAATTVGGRCAAGSLLKAVVTTADPSLRQVTVVTIDAAFTLRATERAEASGTTPVIVPGHLALAAGEALTFVAVTTRKPLADAAVRAAVEQARGSGVPAKGLRGLPLPDDDGSAQRVLLLEATEAPGGR